MDSWNEECCEPEKRRYERTGQKIQGIVIIERKRWKIGSKLGKIDRSRKKKEMGMSAMFETVFEKTRMWGLIEINVDNVRNQIWCVKIHEKPNSYWKQFNKLI